ncbi:MAG: hypothetical protein AB1758_27575 [Candidatus Eremiobacterota bacterium]
MPFLILGLVIYVLCLAMNAIARRPVVNPGKIAFVVIVVLMVAGMALVSSRPEAMGYIMGQALLPLLGFGFASSRFDKKRS